MIDEENKSATMTEAPAAAAAVPAHAAPAGSAPVEPEDTVFSLPLSHVTHDISDLADNEDEEDAVAAPIGAHAAEQPTAPEATPAPAHFAEPVAAAINESAAVFAAPEPAAPAFPIAPASEVAPASTPAPEPIDVSPQDDESTARVSEEPDSPDTGDSESNAETNTVSPGDTAEIDVAAVEDLHTVLGVDGLRSGAGEQLEHRHGKQRHDHHPQPRGLPERTGTIAAIVVAVAERIGKRITVVRTIRIAAVVLRWLA